MNETPTIARKFSTIIEHGNGVTLSHDQAKELFDYVERLKAGISLEKGRARDSLKALQVHKKALQKAERERAELANERKRLAVDKVRLDWLESDFGDRVKAYYLPSSKSMRWAFTMPDGFLSKGKTLREAIDEAFNP